MNSLGIDKPLADKSATEQSIQTLAEKGFDYLNPTQFEEFCFDLLKQLGFINIDWWKGTGLNSSPADRGKDIVCELERRDPDESVLREKWFVECKHHKEAVSVPKLSNLIAWAGAEDADVALIITSGAISNTAKDWIEKERKKQRFRIVYWEQKKLEDLRTKHLMTIEKIVKFYLEDCSKRLTPVTYKGYRDYCDDFLKFLEAGARKPANNLTKGDIHKWINSHNTWRNTTKGNAIAAIRSVFSWAEEQEILKENPLRKIKKPRANVRYKPVSQSECSFIVSSFPKEDPFRDLVLFVWHTGCRWASRIQLEHIDLDKKVIVHPLRRAGGRKLQQIKLEGVALDIVTRLVKGRAHGALFRNKKGNAWKSQAVVCRFQRLSKKIGKKVALSDFCHNAGTIA